MRFILIFFVLLDKSQEIDRKKAVKQTNLHTWKPIKANDFKFAESPQKSCSY
jgi:hypothetical protein